MKNSQTTIALPFLTHNISAIGDVLRLRRPRACHKTKKNSFGYNTTTIALEEISTSTVDIKTNGPTFV